MRTLIWPLVFLYVFLYQNIYYANAHEFWIEPENWYLEFGQELRASLYVGQDFKGSQQIYIPERFTDFDLFGPTNTTPFKGRIGDRPAGQIIPKETGLHIIRHSTTTDNIRYSNLKKFEDFTFSKGWPSAAERHRQRGLPTEGFVEHYRRYAKSLVAVGSSLGSDRDLGLDVEIIALDNPFLTKGDLLKLQVNQDGIPWTNAQVTVFSRPANPIFNQSGSSDSKIEITTGDVVIERYYTNAEGNVDIRVAPGYDYLVDAVALTPLEPEDNDGAVWLTRWASLTFTRAS